MTRYKVAMRTRVSAGLLIYRLVEGTLEVFLAHPGGPFFAQKDDGFWSIPKGQPDRGEELLAAGIREVMEEVGIEVDPEETFIPLGSIRQKGGKIVHAWGVRMDDAEANFENAHTFRMEWPPHSGQKQRFPEVDRGAFFPLDQAIMKIKDTQAPFLKRLVAHLEE